MQLRLTNRTSKATVCIHLDDSGVNLVDAANLLLFKIRHDAPYPMADLWFETDKNYENAPTRGFKHET